MADPLMLSVASAVAGKAAETATEAGKTALAALVRLVRGRLAGHETAAGALDSARGAPELRGWVADRCGIHAPDPAIIPADVGNALRLRAARALESAIDDLTGRQLRVAAHALPLYQSLRPHTTEDQAKDTAIRRASVMYHVPTNTESTAAPGPRTAQPPGPEPRSPGPPQGDGQPGTAARQAASGFPGWPWTRWPLSQPVRPETTSPFVGPRSQAPVPRPARSPNARRQRR